MIKTSDLIWQDTQHQMLFKLIDEMRQEPFNPKVLDQLEFYAEHHFALEEAYMRELAYPKTDAHIRAHNRFREELSQLATEPQSMSVSVRESLSLFLEEWLKRHIFGIDKELESFILENNSR